MRDSSSLPKDYYDVIKEKVTKVEFTPGKPQYFSNNLIKKVGASYVYYENSHGYRSIKTKLDRDYNRIPLEDVEKIYDSPTGITLVEDYYVSPLWCIIDRDGVERKTDFTNARDFCEGMAAVETKNGWGFIDAEGELAIPCKYKMVNDFHDGFATAFNMSNQYVYLDKKGKEYNRDEVLMIKARTEEAKKEIEQAFEKWKKTHDKGEYYKLFHVYEDLGIAVVGKDGSDFDYDIGIIDKNGNTVYETDLLYGLRFEEGISSASNYFSGSSYGKEGYINYKGEVIVPLDKYQSAQHFQNGMAPVQSHDMLWGFVNKNGEEVVPCIYKSVTHFDNSGVAMVRNQDDEIEYIDKTGRAIVKTVVTYRMKHNEDICAETIDELKEKAFEHFHDKKKAEMIEANAEITRHR